MDDFLIKFFPKVYERKLHAKENNYCKYDNQLLQLFTSSLYLAALVASFGASKACSMLGRKPTISMASSFFILGAVVSAMAENKWILIVGRILFGIGVGFGNEVKVSRLFFFPSLFSCSLIQKIAVCSSVLVRDCAGSTSWRCQHPFPTVNNSRNPYCWSC